MKNKRFSQEEYSNLLDSHDARRLGFSQSQCELILMDAGATRVQAKNGAYVYLHHGENTTTYRRWKRGEYESILNDFKAKTKAPMDCIHHLENLGFGYRQAQSAVHRYRKRHELI
jgi:hypothetical protein